MKPTATALVAALHFVLAPGVVVAFIPWLLTGWEPGDAGPAARILVPLGWLLVAVGVTVVAAEFVRFVVEGHGSPAPPAPTERLVTGGLYSRVRNPMYLGVVAAIVGQSAILASPLLLLYAGVVALTVWAFVRWYEEPTLRRQFGAAYDDYCERVPAWLPRLR